MGCVEFSGIVKIYSGDVLDRVRGNVGVEIRWFDVILCTGIHRIYTDKHGSEMHYLAFNRAAIIFAAVAPAPVAPLIVGALGFETSPTANTIGTLVSC